MKRPIKIYLEFFRGSDGQWYWRKKQGNGRVTSDGSEGYSKRSNVLRACSKEAIQYHPDINVIVREGVVS